MSSSENNKYPPAGEIYQWIGSPRKGKPDLQYWFQGEKLMVTQRGWDASESVIPVEYFRRDFELGYWLKSNLSFVPTP